MAGQRGNFDDNNTGTLFKNDAERMRGKSPNFPPYGGKCKIDGREFYVSAWVKESKSNGNKFFSLAFRPVDEVRRGSGGGNGGGSRRDDSRNDDRGGGGGGGRNEYRERSRGGDDRRHDDGYDKELDGDSIPF